MSIAEQLASSLNRRDQLPNQELARELAEGKDCEGIREVVNLLRTGSRDIQSDCIKVLYEVGAVHPELISEYLSDFLDLLKSKNNRLLWGGMTALSTVVAEEPAMVYEHLPEIIDAADRGSVIAKDHAVKILVQLGGIEAFTDDVQVLLLDRLRTSPDNQFPTYAEVASQVIEEKYRGAFLTILRHRLEETSQESKRKRIAKVIQTQEEQT